MRQLGEETPQRGRPDAEEELCHLKSKKKYFLMKQEGDFSEDLLSELISFTFFIDCLFNFCKLCIPICLDLPSASDRNYE